MGKDINENNSEIKLKKHQDLEYLEEEKRKTVWKLTFASSLAVIGIYLVFGGFLTEHFSKGVGIGIGTPLTTGCLTFVLYQLSSFSSKKTEIRLKSIWEGQDKIRKEVRELIKRFEEFSTRP